MTGARGPNPAPRFIDLVAIQLRLSPPASPPGVRSISSDLAYRRWSAAPTRPVTIPPGRVATVQSNFLLRHCHDLAPGRAVAVPGSLVLRYRAAGRAHRKEIPVPGERIVLTSGPTRQDCDPVSGSTSVVAADTGCRSARRAALACHPMSHNSWGVCTVAGVLWDCGSTAGAGAPYLETCDLPRQKSHWFRVRWNPPILSNDAIGGLHLGLPRRKVVTVLSELLGTRSENPPRNTVCGPKYTEVAWRHLYVEFRGGRLAGFRYVEAGWPPSDPGERRIASDLPLLVTSRKLRLGSTLRRARGTYGRLTAVGAGRWRTPDGLVLYSGRGGRITEIEYGTCGDF